MPEDVGLILRTLSELLDRNRRMETRLTRLMEHMGMETQTQRPLWRNGSVDVPSKHAAISEILKVVPDGWDGEVDVYHRGEFICTIDAGED